MIEKSLKKVNLSNLVCLTSGYCKVKSTILKREKKQQLLDTIYIALISVLKYC